MIRRDENGVMFKSYERPDRVTLSREVIASGIERYLDELMARKFHSVPIAKFSQSDLLEADKVTRAIQKKHNCSYEQAVIIQFEER